jgi:hypothetical protein
MAAALDQAMLYLVDLRHQVRGKAYGTAIVDRCLALLAAAHMAGPDEMARLEAEVEMLRTALREHLGEPAPLRVS